MNIIKKIFKYIYDALFLKEADILSPIPFPPPPKNLQADDKIKVYGRAEVYFEPVDTADKIRALIDFAATFDHIITFDDLSEPYLIIKNEKDVWLGYVQIVHDTIAFPAWSPHASTPAEVKKATEGLVMWARIRAALSGRKIPGFVVTMQDSKFTPEIMGKMGFRETNFKLYGIKTGG